MPDVPATAKKPSDKKAKAPALTNGDFVHKSSKGTVTLTRYSRLPFGTLRRVSAIQEELSEAIDQLDRKDEANLEVAQALAAGAEIRIILLQLDAGADKKSSAVIDSLPQDEVGRLYRAWQEHSGTDLGNSSASSDS